MRKLMLTLSAEEFAMLAVLAEQQHRAVKDQAVHLITSQLGREEKKAIARANRQQDERARRQAEIASQQSARAARLFKQARRLCVRLREQILIRGDDPRLHRLILAADRRVDRRLLACGVAA